jgi:hypothetical protein
MKGRHTDLQKRLESIPRDLTFVNASHPDDTKQKHAQKAIRHHVMTRVADSRRKRPRTWTFNLAVPDMLDGGHIGDHDGTQHIATVQQLEPPVPRSLHSYAAFPVDTDARSRQLIQFSIPL